MTTYDIAIIGAGGAGQMAALRSTLNHLNTILFTGDATARRKGRAQWVATVDNIPGYFDMKRPITASTKSTLEFINTHEDIQKYLETVKSSVTEIKKTEDGYTLSDGKETYTAKYVVLTTGIMDVQPEINGSIKPILPFANTGDVEYCIRCDGHRTVGHNTAVIGPGDSAGWISIMLKERYDLPEISILTNGEPFSASDEVTKILKAYKVSIHEEPITDILGKAKTGLEGFVLGDKNIDVSKAFVALGTIVYNDLAKQLGATLNHRDHVVVDDHYQTDVDGFYAAGDLVGGKKKQIYTAWDMAVDAVDHIDGRIRKQKRDAVLNGV